MDEEIIKKLKLLKSIEPDEAFIKRSGYLLLGSNQNIQSPKISWVSFWNLSLALGTLALLIIIQGAIVPQNLALAGLVDTKLQEEMNYLNKGIEEPALGYYTNSNKVVVNALDEISKDTTSHLNNRLLEKEAKEFNIESPVNNKIDGLLDEVSQ